MWSALKSSLLQSDMQALNNDKKVKKKNKTEQNSGIRKKLY